MGGEGCLAVVDEILGGAVVDEDAEALKGILKGHIKDFADGHVKAFVEAGAVDRAGPGGCVVVEAQTAGTVRFGVEVEVEISVSRGLDDHLAGCGQGAVGRCFACAEGFDAADGSLKELAVFDTEFTGQAHAAFPVFFLSRIVIVGQTHPADQDGLVGIAYVGCALGCVEVEAVVEVTVAGFGCKGQGVVIHLADEVDVVVCALGAAGEFGVLGREDQNVTAADIDDVGAFPHAAEILETDNMELSCEGPAGEEVLGLVDLDGALLVQGLGSDEDIIFVIFFVVDDLGIALVFAVVVAGAEEGLRELLGAAVFAQLGGTGVGCADPVLVAVVACVEEIEVIAGADGAAGVAALVVIESIGSQSDSLILPCDEIRT